MHLLALTLLSLPFFNVLLAKRVFLILFSQSKSLLSAALKCSSVVKTVFSESASFMHSFIGFNLLPDYRFLTLYSHDDYVCASFRRHYRLSYGPISPHEEVISIIACAYYVAPCAL